MRWNPAWLAPSLLGVGLVAALATAATLPRGNQSPEDRPPVASAASAEAFAPGAAPQAVLADGPAGAAATLGEAGAVVDGGPAQGATAPSVLPGSWLAVANGDRIRAMLREDEVLWTATTGGVVRWNLADGSYRQYLAPQDGLPSNDVRALLRDPGGVLWVATARGLANLREADDSWQTVQPPAGVGPDATALASDGGGWLWVGFQQRWDDAVSGPEGKPGFFTGGGLARMDRVTGRWDSRVFQAESTPEGDWRTLPSNNITALAMGSDKLLWVGTAPFFRLEDCSAPPCANAWVRRSGGLAATDAAAARWAHWGGSDSDSCVADTVLALAPDAAGRTWVATRGKGLQVFRDGLATEACGAGHTSYRQIRSGQPLPGTKVWSVAVGPDGRVYAGVGGERGQGIAVFDHHGSFGENDSDDEWTALGLDGISGSQDALVSALSISEAGLVAGTIDSRDEREADGYGLKLLDGDGRWRSLATAANGLPGNRISAVAVQPATGDVWFGTDGRGVARWGSQGWSQWRAFGRDGVGATLAASSAPRATELVLAVAPAELAAAFPGQRPKARLGPDDPVLYELYFPSPVPGQPKQTRVQVHPPPEAGLPAGLPVYTVARGPAGDEVTGFTFDGGTTWLSARSSLARRPNPAFGEDGCDDQLTTPDPPCRWDGGLSRFDGQAWQAYEPAVNGLPGSEAQALARDLTGRIWVGTGGPFGDAGRGVGVLDPKTGAWTVYTRTSQGEAFGFDNVTAIAVDPVGFVWLASQGKPPCPTPTSGGNDCPALAGAVARYDGRGWAGWSHRGNPPVPALPEEGAITALHFDRAQGRLWAGGWEGETNFHWNDGFGLNATVHSCPRNCQPSGWSGTSFEDDGAVFALAMDGGGRLWAAGHRRGSGLRPTSGGLRILDGERWSLHTTATTPLPSDNLTALGGAGGTMWLGSFDAGAIQWRPAVLGEKVFLPWVRRER